MAVSLDANSSAVLVDTVASLSATLTAVAPSAAGFGFSGSASDFSATATISSCTYDGNDMTQEVAMTSYQFIQTYAYSYLTTATGSKTASVTFNKNMDLVGMVITVAGGDSSDAVTAGNTVTGSGTTTACDLSCPSVSGELVFGVFGSFDGAGNFTVNAGITELGEATTGGWRASLAYVISNSNPEDIGGDWTNSGIEWRVVAMSFKEAAAAGGVGHRIVGGGWGGRTIGA